MKAPRPRPRGEGEASHLLVDSTDLKLCILGKRLLKKHGTKARRSLRKLHIGMDAVTEQIVAPRYGLGRAGDADGVTQPVGVSGRKGWGTGR